MKNWYLSLFGVVIVFFFFSGTTVQAVNERQRVMEDIYIDPYPNYKVAALLVTFPDNPAKPTTDDGSGSWTKAYVDGVLFSNSNSMAAFYANASRGIVTITGSVFDNDGAWYTIERPAASNTTCDWPTFFSDAVTAADADIDFTAFNTIMVFAPQIACSSTGYAGSVVAPDTNGLVYNAADIDGAMGSTPHHEFGHIIGMSHANSWECDAPGVLTGTNCAEEEYGDRFSVMGVSSRMLQPAAPHKENLGWLLPEEITTVSADGDYSITYYEASTAQPKVLKIPQAWDANGTVTSWYYLEYRRPIGFDNIVRTPTIQELGVPYGALVHVGTFAGQRIRTTLLDMTPGSYEGGKDIFDPALPTGSSYSDPVANVSFGVLSRTETTMTIRVRFSGASLCEWKAPKVTTKALKKSGKPGNELRYSVTVKNIATLCGEQTFSLRTALKPKKWTVTIDKKTKKTTNLIPGKSKTFIIRLQSPLSAAAKKYSAKIETKFVSKPTLKTTTTLKPVVR